jgi:hypothetical protein
MAKTARSRTTKGSLGYAEAFAKFGAHLKNVNWAVSAIANDGALVVSCWEHLFRRAEPGVLRYEDRLSRWSGNGLGNALLGQHLKDALGQQTPVRLVVASTAESDAVDQGHDASNIPKTFHVREDLEGRVRTFDGDHFIVDFRRRHA